MEERSFNLPRYCVAVVSKSWNLQEPTKGNEGMWTWRSRGWGQLQGITGNLRPQIKRASPPPLALQPLVSASDFDKILS